MRGIWRPLAQPARTRSVLLPRLGMEEDEVASKRQRKEDPAWKFLCAWFCPYAPLVSIKHVLPVEMSLPVHSPHTAEQNFRQRAWIALNHHKIPYVPWQ